MAVAPGIAMSVAKTALDAIVDSLDAGTAANCRVRIYDNTAPQPDDPDTAVPTGSVLLASVDMGTAAIFGAAATGTGGSAGSATATASAVLTKSDTSADATGTAAWFRAVDKDNGPKIDGSVGTAAAIV